MTLQAPLDLWDHMAQMAEQFAQQPGPMAEPSYSGHYFLTTMRNALHFNWSREGGETRRRILQVCISLATPTIF